MTNLIISVILSFSFHILIFFSINFFNSKSLIQQTTKITNIKYLVDSEQKDDQEMSMKKTVQKLTKKPIILEKDKINKTSKIFDKDYTKYLSEENDAMYELYESNIVQEISSRIINDIQSIWVKPNNLSKDIYVDFELRLDRLGNINSYKITKSSGNVTFDRAAANAIKKYKRINYIATIDNETYKKHFSVFKLRFIPK
jgi:hypothetical protein